MLVHAGLCEWHVVCPEHTRRGRLRFVPEGSPPLKGNAMPRQIAEMEVSAVKMELPDTKTVRLQWPAGYEIEFKTGQFITLYFPDTPSYKRAYSLSSCALDRGHYEVTVKRDGKMGTRIVDWVKEGDTFTVIPPT